MSISDHVHSIEESSQDDFGYAEPSLSDPSIAIPRAIDSIVSDMDGLCAAALCSDTADIVANEAPAFGQIILRCQLVLGFIEARKAPKLKVVGGNHG